MTVYVEYAVSNGPGTLIEHGVCDLDRGGPIVEADYLILETITPERYQEFLSIHGSERAV